MTHLWFPHVHDVFVAVQYVWCTDNNRHPFTSFQINSFLISHLWSFLPFLWLSLPSLLECLLPLMLMRTTTTTMLLIAVACIDQLFPTRPPAYDWKLANQECKSVNEKGETLRSITMKHCNDKQEAKDSTTTRQQWKSQTNGPTIHCHSKILFDVAVHKSNRLNKIKHINS